MTVRCAWPTLVATPESAITRCTFDNREQRDPDPTVRRLDARGMWRNLRFDFTLNVDESMPAGISEVSGFVLASCRRTSVRYPFELTTSELAGTWQASVDLDRNDLSGTVDVSAELTSIIDGRVRTIGTSEAWTVVVDTADAPKPPGAPPFKTAWVRFDDPDAPLLAHRYDGAHALMLLEPAPTMYLNEAVPGLQELLHADNAKTERRRLRDVTGSGIARYALDVLFRAGAGDVVRFSEEDAPPEPPDNALLRQACEAVADAMQTVGSVDELYQLLVERAAGDAKLREDLWAEIDLAIDDLCDCSTTIASATKDVQYG